MPSASMSKVTSILGTPRGAGGKPVSREDGLRSFGTLLRTGRIEKVTRGHYTLADNSPYLAEARRLT